MATQFQQAQRILGQRVLEAFREFEAASSLIVIAFDIHLLKSEQVHKRECYADR